MCLLGVVFQMVPDCPVLIVANREEIYARPTAAPRIHEANEGHPAWLGGLDLVAGGTWLGVNAFGLVVAVTNRPKRELPAGELRSRGWLCRRLLQAPDPQTAERYALRELKRLPFAGCNLVIAGRSQGMVIEAGEALIAKPLEPGVQLITNGDLNAPDDRRIARVRSELAAAVGLNLDAWLTLAVRLCGARADHDLPAICLEKADRGTVSSTLLALPHRIVDSRYLYAPGPPSRIPYDDYSPLLTELLRRGLPAHRIQLRGPWGFTPISIAGNGDRTTEQRRGDMPPAGIARLPASWQSVFGDFRGRVRFERKFHRPSNLEADESVWLVFEAVGGDGQATLNGQRLGTIYAGDEPQRFDITNVLRGDEQLLVELEFTNSSAEAMPGGLYAPVFLEIVHGIHRNSS